MDSHQLTNFLSNLLGTQDINIFPGLPLNLNDLNSSRLAQMAIIYQQLIERSYDSSFTREIYFDSGVTKYRINNSVGIHHISIGVLGLHHASVNGRDVIFDSHPRAHIMAEVLVKS